MLEQIAATNTDDDDDDDDNNLYENNNAVMSDDDDNGEDKKNINNIDRLIRPTDDYKEGNSSKSKNGETTKMVMKKEKNAASVSTTATK